MKVGDYVRNKYGIAKVIDIENNNGIDILVFDKPICFLVNKETGKIKDDRLLNRLAIIDGVDVSKIKSSPNIIELLETMDLLYIDISPDDCGGIVVPRIPETLNELEKYIEKIKTGEYILKYVVTHEQLENNMYKVGE